jgi:NlpC/P60 family
MIMPTAARARRFVLHRVGAAVLAVLGCVAGLLVATTTSPAAAATPATAHDPIGTLESVAAAGPGLWIVGWAADPDSRANVIVGALVDGRSVPGEEYTSIARPAVRAHHQTGATPGFYLRLTPPRGAHIVCIVAYNFGPGLTGVLKCFATPLGRRLSGEQRTARSPQGLVTGVSGHPHSIHVRGWVTDPDMVGRHSVVVAYVDGAPAATFRTQAYPGPRPAGAGRYSRFDRRLGISTGAHVACIWVVNVGLGHNSYLGCQAIDTRGPAGTGRVTTPALNRKVFAEAKKHIGQPYVWAATGPKKFDCSGLVKYSYKRFGFTTPRIAADQFRAARLIPATRAVPGDLVFYSDAKGEVYHVGVYSGPGMSVAAIDPQDGVDWQRVWPSSTTYFGSFTHI